METVSEVQVTTREGMGKLGPGVQGPPVRTARPSTARSDAERSGPFLATRYQRHFIHTHRQARVASALCAGAPPLQEAFGHLLAVPAPSDAHVFPSDRSR